MIDWMIGIAAGFFLWWHGYFTASVMAVGKRDDEQADEYEQIRRPEL